MDLSSNPIPTDEPDEKAAGARDMAKLGLGAASMRPLSPEVERARIARLSLAALEGNFRRTAFLEFAPADRELLLSSLEAARLAYRALN